MENIHLIDIELIKKLMAQNDIDDKKLSNLTGFSLNFIKRFLGGANQRHYSAMVIIRLCKVFNVPANSLLHDEYKQY